MTLHRTRPLRLAAGSLTVLGVTLLLAGCPAGSGSTPASTTTDGSMMSEGTMTEGTMSESPDAMMTTSPDAMTTTSPDAMMSETPDAMSTGS